MKKLFMLILGVVMVLAMPVVSTALDISYMGEVDFYFNPDIGGSDAAGTEVDLLINLNFNEEVTARTGIQALSGAGSTDGSQFQMLSQPTYLIFNESFAKITIFNDNFNWNGDIDRLTLSKALHYTWSASAVKIDIPVGTNYTLTAAVFPDVQTDILTGKRIKTDQRSNDDGYSVGAGYTSETLGVNGGILQSEEEHPGYAVNADYKLGSFKPFIEYGVRQYDTDTAPNPTAIIGLLYGVSAGMTDTPFGFRIEYNLQENDNQNFAAAFPLDNNPKRDPNTGEVTEPSQSKAVDKSHAFAFYLDYRLTNGLIFRYRRVSNDPWRGDEGALLLNYSF